VVLKKPAIRRRLLQIMPVLSDMILSTRFLLVIMGGKGRGRSALLLAFVPYRYYDAIVKYGRKFIVTFTLHQLTNWKRKARK
jgi:Tfp pilus assembly ATPase PilU